jgi:hypothetical protein
MPRFSLPDRNFPQWIGRPNVISKYLPDTCCPEGRSDFNRFSRHYCSAVHYLQDILIVSGRVTKAEAENSRASANQRSRAKARTTPPARSRLSADGMENFFSGGIDFWIS